MKDYKKSFKNISWQYPAEGVMQKLIKTDSQQIRLVRFDDTFFEIDWCEKEHIGYVIKGKMTIDFIGQLITYSEGDLLMISNGKENKHKAHIEKGDFVELILFEPI